ncbi:MAG: hypothetical protein R2830_22945 [Saprospiraceae bacterium]
MKNTIWVIAVLLLAFLGDRAGGYVLGKITHDSQFRYSRLYRGGENCDLLFAGNSRGLIFYQPYIEEKTGRPTCNLSYNGMPMDLAAVLIKDFLDRNSHPRILVLDVTMLDKRMDSRLVTGFNCYVPFSERLSDLMRDSFANDFFAGQVAHLYRYNSEVFQRAFYYLKKSDEDWLLDRVISPILQKEVEKQGEFDYEFTPDMLASLAGVVNYATQKGVRVALVVNPYYPPFAEKIGNLPALKKAIEQATGITVHDYSNSISGVEGFGDYQHLNKNGAKEYLDKLMEDGILGVSEDLGGGDRF